MSDDQIWQPRADKPGSGAIEADHPQPLFNSLSHDEMLAFIKARSKDSQQDQPKSLTPGVLGLGAALMLGAGAAATLAESNRADSSSKPGGAGIGSERSSPSAPSDGPARPRDTLSDGSDNAKEPPPLSQEDISYVSDLAKRAGKRAVEMRHTVEIRTKGEPDDFETTADQELSRMISSGLKERFPNDVVITEEDSKAVADAKAAQATGKRVWVIDSIDGTDNYIKNDGEYAVQIGALDKGRPTYGWVYQPTAERLAYGSKEHGGAWIQRGDAPPEKIPPVAPINPDRPLRLQMGGRDFREHPEAQKLPVDWVRTGSVGVKVLNIVDGKGTADAFTHLGGHLKVWDTAGPVAIARAAGLEVSGGNGTPVTYALPETVHAYPIFIGRKGSTSWAVEHNLPVGAMEDGTTLKPASAPGTTYGAGQSPEAQGRATGSAASRTETTTAEGIGRIKDFVDRNATDLPADAVLGLQSAERELGAAAEKGITDPAKAKALLDGLGKEVTGPFRWGYEKAAELVLRQPAPTRPADGASTPAPVDAKVAAATAPAVDASADGPPSLADTYARQLAETTPSDQAPAPSSAESPRAVPDGQTAGLPNAESFRAELAKNPKAIAEIPKIAAEKGVAVTEELLRVMRDHPEAWKSLTPEQAKQVLNDTLLAQHPEAGLRVLMDSGYMHEFMPELTNLQWKNSSGELVNENARLEIPWHREADVWEHEMLVAKEASAAADRAGLAADAKLKVMLSAITHDISMPETRAEKPDGKGGVRIMFPGHADKGAVVAERMLTRLGYDTDTVKTVTAIDKHHMELHDEGLRDVKVKTLLSDIGVNNAKLALVMQEADSLGSAPEPGLTPEDDRKLHEDRVNKKLPAMLEKAHAELTKAPAAVKAADLFANGFKGKGDQIGKELTAARNAQDEFEKAQGRFEDADAAKAWADNYLRQRKAANWAAEPAKGDSTSGPVPKPDTPVPGREAVTQPTAEASARGAAQAAASETAASTPAQADVATAAEAALRRQLSDTSDMNADELSAKTKELADLLYGEKRFAEADPLYRHALDLIQRTGGELDKRQIPLLENLAGCRINLGDETGFIEVADYYSRLKRAPYMAVRPDDMLPTYPEDDAAILRTKATAAAGKTIAPAANEPKAAGAGKTTPERSDGDAHERRQRTAADLPSGEQTVITGAGVREVSDAISRFAAGSRPTDDEMRQAREDVARLQVARDQLAAEQKDTNDLDARIAASSEFLDKLAGNHGQSPAERQAAQREALTELQVHAAQLAIEPHSADAIAQNSGREAIVDNGRAEHGAGRERERESGRGTAGEFGGKATGALILTSLVLGVLFAHRGNDSDDTQPHIPSVN